VTWFTRFNHRATREAILKDIPESVGIVFVIDLSLRQVITKEDDMIDNKATTVRRRNHRLARGAVGLLLAGGIAGGALAAAAPASAADSATSTAAAPARSATPVRAGQKALTGTRLATAKAAALKAVPGGSVYRVETDANGATYQAHMTKADGTQVTVKFDKSFKVTSIQNGMRADGPARTGHLIGHRPDGPGQTGRLIGHRPG
jgi:hypothetical protein